MQLTIDFSKLATLDAIKAEILTFLKDNMVQSGTVFYEIQKSGKGGSPVKRMHYPSIYLGLRNRQLIV